MNGKNPGRSLTFENEPNCKKSDFLHVFAAAVLIFLLPACSQVLYETVTFADEFDHTTVTRSTGNVLAGFPISKRVSLNAECRVKQNGTKAFYLIAEYFHESLLLKEWLAIDTTEHIVLRIDGRVMRLPAMPGRYIRQFIEGYPSETAVYEAPYEIFEKFLEAREVIVRIRGSGQTVERKFDSENYQFMRRFLEEVRK